nr:hypothetical protein [Tanacetum cinerariifolium]
MISNDFVVKLCLEHEVKKGNKVVKKELIVALRGEVYFLKFIINPEEDDVEPVVIFGRSFLRLTKAITDFRAGTITIYPEIDPFLEDIEKIEKSRDLTQEEAAKEALTLKISQRFALLEEVRLVLETMAYNEKYKKVLDEIWKDKVELDGMIKEEEEKAINKVKGEAFKEKDNLGAFIFPIIIKGNVNKGIKMINHTQAEAMGILMNVLCQVGVTTLIAKFLILDIPIDQDTPIVVGRGFLYTMGGIVNTPERLFLTFDEICHQTFHAARSNVLRTVKSDSDEEEEYEIKRNKFGAPIMRCGEEIDEMLRIRLREAGSNEEIFTSVTYANVAWLIASCIKRKGAGTQKESQICCRQIITKLARNVRVLSDEVIRSLSAPVYCRDLNMTTLTELIDSKGWVVWRYGGSRLRGRLIGGNNRGTKNFRPVSVKPKPIYRPKVNQPTGEVSLKMAPSAEKNVSTISNSLKKTVAEDVDSGDKTSMFVVHKERKSSTPLDEKINLVEQQLLAEKCVFLDVEGKPVDKIDYTSDHDSEDEIQPVYNEMAKTIRVGYEWETPHCSTCSIFGNSVDDCPKSPKRMVNRVDKVNGESFEDDDDGLLR